MLVFQHLSSKHGSDFAERMAAIMDEVRNPAEAAKRLGLTAHEKWVEIMPRIGAAGKLMSRFARRQLQHDTFIEILYRCDMASMYSSKRTWAKSHEQKQRERRKVRD
eukprot:5050631-Pyramimonas_sp.AAC.1